MELSEVINVQFAVPVIGVVVCAVLVFAFGFKSPGQPPSFDILIDDDRKSKRNRNRRSGGAHGEKHKSASSVASTGDDDDEASTHSPAPKPTSDGVKLTSGRPASAAVADKAKIKPVKSAEEPAEISSREDKLSVGGWTTAVSKKDKKNRSKKDEKIPTSFNEPAKPVNPAYKDSAKPPRNNKKLSELTTVTVVVPGPPSANSSVTETSTTITETAVIKVKVVPSVRVSVSAHQTPNGHAVMDRRITSKPSSSSSSIASGSVRGSSSVAPWAKTDSEVSKSTEKPALILGFDDWAEVQSSRSPKKKRANLEDGHDKSKTVANTTAADVMYNQLPDSSVPAKSSSVTDTSTASTSSFKLTPGHANTGPVTGSPAQSADNLKDKPISPGRKNIPSSASSDSKIQQTIELSAGAGDKRTATVVDKAVDDTPDASRVSASVDGENLGKVDASNEDSQSAEESGDWQEAKSVKKKKSHRKLSASHAEY